MDAEAREADIRRKIEADYPFSEEPDHITPEAYERWLDRAVRQVLREEERESQKRVVTEEAHRVTIDVDVRDVVRNELAALAADSILRGGRARAQARADTEVQATAAALASALADTDRRIAQQRKARAAPTPAPKPARKRRLTLAEELAEEQGARVQRALSLDPPDPAPTKKATGLAADLEREQAEAIRRSLGG